MSNYLLTHYKGIYRLRTSIDESTNTFPREYTGQFAENDIYIDCQNNNKIFYCKRNVLQAYIPSIGRGHNIIKTVQSNLGENIIYDIEETDTEVLFKFNVKYDSKIIPLLKPKTSGASISPFSSRNLPKSDYKIPDEDLLAYKEIVSKIPRERILNITHSTNNYLKSLVTKNNSWDNIKADMALKCLKGKEYIHSIGKWNEYIKCLERVIKQ